MKKNLLILLTLAAAALAVPGCASHNQVDLLDESVEQSISYSDILDTRLPDGRLQVVAHLRNLENRRLQVQVNCEFKDANGVVIDSTPFVDVILTENASEDVKFVSMNDKAARCNVRIRQAR